MDFNVKKGLEKLLADMAEAEYQDFDVGRLKELVEELSKSGVKGIDSFVQKLMERVGDRQEYLDITKEGRFALILSRNGFSNIYVEYSQSGPDIKADYAGQTIYFEVTRRRPNKEDDEWVQEGTTFVAPDRAENIIAKIRNELSHFKEGEINVVVYWSSTIRVGTFDLKDAFEYIKDEISKDPVLYRKLSGVVFTEEEAINIPSLKEYYLFINDMASRPLSKRLAKKLESLHTDNPRKLKARYQHLM